MKTNIYEELLKQEPKDMNSKEYKKWEKELRKSIGWIELMPTARFFLDEKGNPSSSSDEENIVWSVQDKEGMMDFQSQEMAVIYSLLLQMNERIKKLENKKEEKEW